MAKPKIEDLYGYIGKPKGGGLWGMTSIAGRAGSSVGKVKESVTGEAAAKQQAAAQDKATDAQIQTAREAQKFLVEQSEKGQGFLNQSQLEAEAALRGGNEWAREYQGTGRRDQLAELQSGQNQALGYLSNTPNRLAQMYQEGIQGDFTADPGYQFRLQQGEQAIQRAAAAGGGRMGGDTLKALAEYNQNFASNEYDQFKQRQLAEAQYRAGVASGADQGDMSMNSQAAQYAYGGGQQRAGVQGAYANNMANNYSQQGSQLANLYTGTASGKANLGIGAAAQNSNLSSAMMQAYQNPVQYAGGAAAANSNFIQNMGKTALMGWMLGGGGGGGPEVIPV